MIVRDLSFNMMHLPQSQVLFGNIFSLTGGVGNGKKNPNKKYKPGNSLDINAKLARPLWKKHNSTHDLSLKEGGVDTQIYMQIAVVACKIAGAVWKESSKQSWG